MPVGKIKRSAFQSLPISPSSNTKNILWDVEIKGFGAYKTSAETVSFIYQYRMPGGKTRSTKLGNHGELSVEQARDEAAKLAYQRRCGIDPLAERERLLKEEIAKIELVLGNYAESYLQRRIDAGKPHNGPQVGIIRRDVIGGLGHLRMDQMTVEDVEAFAKTLGERGPSARRMGLVYLNVILNDAVTRGKIAYNPAKPVEVPPSGERSRRLRTDELQRLLEAADDLGGVRGDIVEVLVRLVKRKEEISRMTWEQLDLSRRVLELPDMRSKNREPYTIELPQQVYDIIVLQQPDPALRRGPVFTLDGGRTSPEMGSQVKDLLDANLHRRLELANERDGTAHAVAHYTLHDLRTTVASMLEEKPFMIPSSVIDAILLHKKEGKVTRTYQRATFCTEAGEALQRWNDWLDELMAGITSWPGGRKLDPMKPRERKTRLAALRDGWPLRTDQQKAKERREQEAAGTKRRRKRKD